MKYLPASDVDEERRDGGEHRRGHVHVVGLLAGAGVHDVVERHHDRRVAAEGVGRAEQEVVPDVGELQITETIRIGPEIGSMTLKKMRKKPAPSTCAALISSCGTLM